MAERRRPGHGARIAEHLPTAVRATCSSLRERGLFSRSAGLNLQWSSPTRRFHREPDRGHERQLGRATANGSSFRADPAAQQVFADYGYRPVVKSVRTERRSSRSDQVCSRSTSRPRRLTVKLLRTVEQHHVARSSARRWEQADRDRGQPSPAPSHKDRAATALPFGAQDDLSHGHRRAAARRARVGGDERGSQSFWTPSERSRCGAGDGRRSLAVSVRAGNDHRGVLVRDASAARRSSTRSSTSPSPFRPSSRAHTARPLWPDYPSASTSRSRGPRSSWRSCSCAPCSSWSAARPAGARSSSRSSSVAWRATTTTFRRIAPNILPGILGVALACEGRRRFGSLVIIMGTSFKTEVSSSHLRAYRSGDSAGAAAVAVVLLGISFATLLLDRPRPRLREARPMRAVVRASAPRGRRPLPRGPRRTAGVVFWRTFEDGFAPPGMLATPERQRSADPDHRPSPFEHGLDRVRSAIVRRRFPGKGVLNAFIDLPRAVAGRRRPALFPSTANGWFGGWLSEHGIQVLFALPSMVIATIFASLPFVARESTHAREIGDEQEQRGARSSGRLATFWRITCRRSGAVITA